MIFGKRSKMLCGRYHEFLKIPKTHKALTRKSGGEWGWLDVHGEKSAAREKTLYHFVSYIVGSLFSK